MNILKSKFTKVLLVLSLLAGNAFAQIYSLPEDYIPQLEALLAERVGDFDSVSDVYNAYINFPEIIENAIKAKIIDVNKIYYNDNTLLIYAATRKQPESITLAKFLIENGADINLCKPEKFNNEKELYYNTALYEAIDCNNVEMALFLLDAGASADYVNHYHNTSLMHAIYRNQKDIAFEILKKNLISKKALNYWSEYGDESALMMAINHKMFDLAEEIVKAGADVNIETDNGSALYLACKQENENLIKLLLEKGAKPNPKNPEKSPLRAVTNNLELVKLLVEKGAKVNGKDAPIIGAIQNENIAVMEYLISKGAKIETKTEYGYTPLLTAILDWNVDAILLLEKHKANWKAVSNDGENAIHCMLYSEYLLNYHLDENRNIIDDFNAIAGKNFLSYLISKGVDINKKDKENGWTPLMVVINSNFITWGGADSFVRELLKNGADPNTRGNEGETALLCALFHPKIVKLLLEYGADPKAKVSGKTALETAKSLLKTFPEDGLKETVAILSELEENGAENITLTEALLMGNVQLSKKLLDKLSDINQPDSEGRYAINSAIRSENIEIVKLVLAHNPDLSKTDKGYEYPPLQRAVVARNKEIVKLLIEAGADVNQQYYDGLYYYYGSPLYSAVGLSTGRAEYQPDLELVKILVEAGADINLKGGYDKETLFMTAVTRSSKEVIKYLLSKNPDIFALDNKGRSVFDYASSESKKILNKEIENQFLNKKKTVKENLNVRAEPDIYGNKLFTLKGKSPVKIVEIGEVTVIDNICSVWVKIETQSGAKTSDGKEIKIGSKGWCFAGYLN